MDCGTTHGKSVSRTLTLRAWQIESHSRTPARCLCPSRNTKDKTQLVKEALRVVKKGGKFCFQDLHEGGGTYGNPGELLGAIRGWGVEEAEFVDTSKVEFIPGALRNSLMVGNIGIIYGTK
jgi:hypothetical protein